MLRIVSDVSLARKTKCDGQHPTCSSCERRSLACNYVNEPNANGGGRGKRSNVAALQAAHQQQQQQQATQNVHSSQNSPVDAKPQHEANSTPHAHSLSQAHAQGQGYGQLHSKTRPGSPSVRDEQQQLQAVKVKGELLGNSPSPPGSTKRSLPDDEHLTARDGPSANKKLRVDYGGNGGNEDSKPPLVDVRASA